MVIFRTLKYTGAAAIMAAVIGWAGASAASWFYPLGEVLPVPRLSDKPAPFLDVPDRPAMPLELGCKFLGTGKLPEGFKIPGGAVWSPCLWVFGTYRAAMATYEAVGPAGRNTEAVHRLDLFANLQLTTTEKCIVGVAPMDKNRFTSFSRYSLESNQGEGGHRPEYGLYVRTAFCEGDFGSLFPNLDPRGTNFIDYGFSVGRQQITFQEGIMINDFLDAVGIVRNNMHFPGFPNVRATALFALDHIDRGSPASRRRLNEAGLYGLFLQADTAASTWALDFIAITDDEERSTGGDGYFVGLAATQRGWNPFNGIGTTSTTYRINASIGDGADTQQVADGVLLSAEISITPHSSDDVAYFNPFWGIDRYTSASREPILGGPLAALGISFASPSLGNHLSELSAFNTEVAGFALGYQAFWDNHRRNLVLEIAGVKDTTRNLFNNNGAGTDAAAFTFQLQQAVGQRVQLQLDGFVAYIEGRDNGSGARFEVLVQF
jgi:hypothetical protein